MKPFPFASRSCASSPRSLTGAGLALPLLLTWLAGACASSAPSNGVVNEPTTNSVADGFGDHVEGLAKLDGFLPLYWDSEKGRVLFETAPADQDILYYVSLPAGLGSNDVGLDRAQIGKRQLVRFRSVGAKVLLVAPNMDWRSSAASEMERAGVRDSFAESVLWGFDVVARDGERVLVDGTSFFLRDAHGVARSLARSKQGSFRLEASRSALSSDGLRSFPSNSEIEALLTFTSDSPGSEVRQTAADPSAVTLRVRHSFVKLPDLAQHDYSPRKFDPRSGFGALAWNDAATPIDVPMRQRVIRRHHLTQAEPIVYYIDSAAPEPVRSALLDGARYWVAAFAAAGFPDGFRVELLPAGTDPQDIRYNVVTWVNRSTRGWSYGDSLADPRTGEILKGHVTLGALRVRQDVLLMEGLLSPYADGRTHDDRVTGAALDRIRQLAAHEIGHTLGLTHNFASSMDGRESVMDYPAPLIKLNGDEIDVSDAYRDGCGAWDLLTIRYGYAAFDSEESEDSEVNGLASVLADMRAKGLRYLSDSDARGPSQAHPAANLWDNGRSAIEATADAFRIRRIALERLSEAALIPGRPLADLEAVLVPVYLHHRYQIEAAIRLIGGIEYDYEIVSADDEPRGWTRVDLARQEAALDQALESLTPAFLALPTRLQHLLVPPPPGHGRSRESFSPGARFFDPLDAARSSIEITLDLLLNPERTARLADQTDDGTGLLIRTVFERLLVASFSNPPADPHEQTLYFEVQDLVLRHLMRLAANESTDTRVRSVAWLALEHLSETGAAQPWHQAKLARFLADPAEEAPTPASPRIPPGSPIGCSE